MSTEPTQHHVEPPSPSDGRQLLRAPYGLDHLVLSVSVPFRTQFRDLFYEGFNPLLRAGAHDAGEVAAQWRSLALGARGVFVLRDSLFSQQDHPYELAPHALMMPPSWVAVAIAEVQALRPMQVPAIDDDAAWSALDSATLFGSFPASAALFERAVRKRDRPQETLAARASLRSLSADVAAMIAAAPRGREAVAAAGADRIAESDVRYFGASLRHHRFIPLLVENPNRREMVREGKGFIPEGRTLPEDAVRLARDAVLRRRLADGDIAIERYDLSDATQQARAIAVLEALVPENGTGKGNVWLWVTGKLDASGERGENPEKYFDGFLAKLEAAHVDHARVRVLGKPAFEPKSRAELIRAAGWHRQRHLPMAVALSTEELVTLLGQMNQ